eukprot:m.23350 g.23350  ORF g.23350 m.23350 type:complete len:58 (+) comp13143_c0_seq1:131-304(+)
MSPLIHTRLSFTHSLSSSFFLHVVGKEIEKQQRKKTNLIAVAGLKLLAINMKTKATD